MYKVKQRTLAFPNPDLKTIETTLDHAISEGWRVVASIPAEGGVIVVIERDVVPTDHRRLPVV